MKTTMKILPLMLGIMLFFTQCEKEALDTANTNAEAVMDLKQGDCTVVQTLWAGAGQNDTLNGTNVGQVTATLDGNILHVTYLVNAPFYLTEGHLWVGKDKLKIPRNAAPGRFPFKANLDFESDWYVEVNLTALGIDPENDEIFVAAHGVVVDGIDGVEGLNELLPQDVTYFVNYQGPPLSYFSTTVNHDGFLEGVYDGWCVDTKNQIATGSGATYNAIAYSSYGYFPSELFDKPENFVLINWIINNNFIGKESETVPGTTFTRGDLQKAMWQLLEFETEDIGGEGPFNQTRVNEIKDLAMESGADFVPECGEKVVIILYVPDADPGVQITIIEYPVPCGGGSETVWAYGEHQFDDPNNFIARKWGWIFEVDCINE